ncbi:MAG TPA: radical SAM protein [Sphingopyxis sp.]|nr:radical SAM protein [Sphingopyxis sp.]
MPQADQQLRSDRDAPAHALAAFLPPHAGALIGLLTPQDRETLDRIALSPPARSAFPAASMTAIMKATRLCNLRCTYCHSWRGAPSRPMTFEVMARATRDLLSSPAVREVDFVWHGGEVTLLPVAFFAKAVYLQLLFKRTGQTVRNAIQTNATLISDGWIDFWQAHDFEVGVSIDATPELHDSRRLDKAGRGSWAAVQRGVARLKAGGIRFGGLAVLTEDVLAVDPARYLESLAECGLTGVALLNAIPDASGERRDGDSYLPFDAFVDFMVRLYAVWDDRFRGVLSIREFESLENNVADGKPLICVHSASCMGRFITVEPTGEVAPCDKYDGGAGFHFGRLGVRSLADQIADAPGMAALRAEEASLKAAMAPCPFVGVCRGGCPHDARMRAAAGLPGGCCGLRPLIEEIEARKRRKSDGTSSRTDRGRI